MENTSLNVTVNSEGNYEITEYNPSDHMQITLEFLNTADGEELSREIRQILKNEYLRNIDSSGTKRAPRGDSPSQERRF